MGYTQSTVSQQIAILERSVGGPVFDRPGGPRAVRLTPLGDLVLERGRHLLRGADDLSNAVERFRAGGGRIDIGTLQSVSTVILPALVSRLKEEYPDCDVALSEEEAETRGWATSTSVLRRRHRRRRRLGEAPRRSVRAGGGPGRLPGRDGAGAAPQGESDGGLARDLRPAADGASAEGGRRAAPGRVPEREQRGAAVDGAARGGLRDPSAARGPRRGRGTPGCGSTHLIPHRSARSSCTRPGTDRCRRSRPGDRARPGDRGRALTPPFWRPDAI